MWKGEEAHDHPPTRHSSSGRGGEGPRQQVAAAIMRLSHHLFVQWTPGAACPTPVGKGGGRKAWPKVLPKATPAGAFLGLHPPKSWGRVAQAGKQTTASLSRRWGFSLGREESVATGGNRRFTTGQESKAKKARLAISSGKQMGGVQRSLLMLLLVPHFSFKTPNNAFFFVPWLGWRGA